MLLADKISKYFTYKEALWLPTWNRAAIESDGLTPEIIENLKELFGKMDSVREHFSMPVIVHVTYRPPAYNTLVGGAPHSAHTQGKACDFHISGSTCDAIRQKILEDNILETLNLRMENLPKSSWIHLDTANPSPNRFFIP